MRPNQMTHPGAVTAYTAMMLAAKVHLLKEEYSTVESLTDNIIQNGGFSLFNDYYNLFKIPGKLCDESLFECQVTDFGLGSGDYVGVDQWFNFMGPFSLTNPDTGQSFGGWGFIGYEPEFVAWADARGETIRAETAFLRGGQPTREGWVVSEGRGTSTDCWNGKGYLPWNQMTEGRTTYGQNNNVRVFRYAEVLLMNAEAKVRQGKNGDTPYNLVRERANMSPKTGATLADIMDERRMELCGEWVNRYVDLVRTGDAATALGPKGWNESKTYWPIPASQRDDLPDLLLDPID